MTNIDDGIIRKKKNFLGQLLELVPLYFKIPTKLLEIGERILN